MDSVTFWSWTVFFAFLSYLFAQTICICCLRDTGNVYLPLLQPEREDSDDEATNIDYADYVSIVSTIN